MFQNSKFYFIKIFVSLFEEARNFFFPPEKKIRMLSYIYLVGFPRSKIILKVYEMGLIELILVWKK